MKKYLMLMVGIVGISLMLTGCGGNSRLEESAKPLVTQILKENLGSTAAECVTVELGNKITDNLYNATAILSNGNKLPITIFDKGENIVVTVK